MTVPAPPLGHVYLGDLCRAVHAPTLAAPPAAPPARALAFLLSHPRRRWCKWCYWSDGLPVLLHSRPLPPPSPAQLLLQWTWNGWNGWRRVRGWEPIKASLLSTIHMFTQYFFWRVWARSVRRRRLLRQYDDEKQVFIRRKSLAVQSIGLSCSAVCDHHNYSSKTQEHIPPRRPECRGASSSRCCSCCCHLQKVYLYVACVLEI